MKKFSQADLASMRDAAAQVNYSVKEYKPKRQRIGQHKDCQKVGSSEYYGRKRFHSFEDKYNYLKACHEEFIKTHSEPEVTKITLRIGSKIKVTVLGIPKVVVITSQEALEAYKGMNWEIAL